MLVLARIAPLFVLAPLFSLEDDPGARRAAIVAVGARRRPHAARDARPAASRSTSLALGGLMLKELLVGLAFAFALGALFAARQRRRLAARHARSASPSARSSTRSPATSRRVLVAALRARRRRGLHRHRRRRLGHPGPRAHLRRSCRSLDAPALGSLVAGVAARVHRRSSPPRSRSPRRCCSRVIITDAAFGVVSRVVPQLNVFAVGFPAKVDRRPAAHRRLAAVRRRLDRRPAPAERRRRAADPEGRADMAGATTRPRRQHPRSAKRRARRARSPSRTTSTARSCCSPACSRSAPTGAAPRRRRSASSMRDAFGADRARRDVVDAPRPRPAVHADAGEGGRPRPSRPVAFACVARRRARQRRPGRLQAARRRRSSPTPSGSTRSRASRTCSARTRSSRAARTSPRSRSSAPIAALARAPEARPSSPRSSACRPATLVPTLAHMVLAHRPARRRSPTSLIGDRRLRLPALPPREVAEDGQAGGQGGAQAARAPGRGQAARSAAARCRPPRARMMAAVPTADVVVTNPTHFAVALRYDAEKAAPEVVAKGKDLIAAADPRDRRRERRARRRRPAAGALAARVGRGRPARSPRSSTRPSRRSSPTSTASPPRRRARRMNADVAARS